MSLLDKFNSPTIIQFEFLLKASEFLTTHSIFYTDDSKLDESSAGVDIYSPDLEINLNFRLPPKTSVFLAAAWAILQALLIAQKNGYRNVIIFIDSRSILKTIKRLKLNRGNYLINLIKNELWQAKQTDIVIVFFWVPAHKDITGNEIANQLGKEECSSNNRPDY